MAGITEEETWESEVYQLEITDPVQGGPEGVDNLPHKALANRTVWLKAQLLLKALKGGSATQLFKVKAAVAGDDAVNKNQMETAISGISTGKILQVVQTATATEKSTSTIADFDLMSAVITPKKSTSKILITIQAYVGAGNNETWWLKRNSTKIGGTGSNNSPFQEPDSFMSSDSPVAEGSNSLDCIVFNYIDTPNTINEITYTMGALLASSGFTYFNRSGTANGVAATSTITLTEIGK